MSFRQMLGKIGLWFAVFIIVSPAILFFLWMASLSLKYEVDNAAYPPVFFPERIAWKNYADVLASNRFLTYFINSLLVTGTATFLAMMVGVPAGYGIARMAAHKSAIVILIARITPGLSVIFSWNNFVFGIVLAGRETRTLPVAVYNMISFDQLSWGPLAAAALIVTFPVLLLTVLAQRQIVAGLTAGAVKGG